MKKTISLLGILSMALFLGACASLVPYQTQAEGSAQKAATDATNAQNSASQAAASATQAQNAAASADASVASANDAVSRLEAYFSTSVTK